MHMLDVHVELWANRIVKFQQKKFPTADAVASIFAVRISAAIQKATIMSEIWFLKILIN